MLNGGDAIFSGLFPREAVMHIYENQLRRLSKRSPR